MQSPVLALLRRLEAQNVWRVGYTAMPQQNFATAAPQQQDVSPSPNAPPSAFPDWYEDASLSAQEALKLLVNHIRDSGPVSKCDHVICAPNASIFRSFVFLFNSIQFG
jgi:hypothetical protein